MNHIAVWIPDWIWKHFPDSMGAFISAVGVALHWILRLVLLRRTENGTSPFRGIFCNVAALCGAIALVALAVALFGLLHITEGMGLLLVMVLVPVSLLAGVCGFIFYMAAWGDAGARAEPSRLPSMPPGSKDAA